MSKPAPCSSRESTVQICFPLGDTMPKAIGYRLWIEFADEDLIHHVEAGFLQDNDYSKDLMYKPLPIRHDIKRFAESMRWYDRFEPLGKYSSWNPRYKDPLIAKKRQQTALAILADALDDDASALALSKRFGEEYLKGRESVGISRCAVQEICWRIERAEATCKGAL